MQLELGFSTFFHLCLHYVSNPTKNVLYFPLKSFFYCFCNCILQIFSFMHANFRLLQILIDEVPNFFLKQYFFLTITHFLWLHLYMFANIFDILGYENVIKENKIKLFWLQKVGKSFIVIITVSWIKKKFLQIAKRFFESKKYLSIQGNIFSFKKIYFLSEFLEKWRDFW